MARRLLLLLALGLLAPSAARAHPSWGIVVDAAGRVVFSDLETVWRVDASGRLAVVRAGVSGRHVHQITLDEAGNLYGADWSYDPPRWQSAVWRITPAGEFAYLLAPTYEPPRGLTVERDRAGNSYAVETDGAGNVRLLRRAPDGRLTTLAGGPAGFADGRGPAARFTSVTRLSAQPDGTLYLIDGGGALRRVSPAGEVSTLARGLDRFALADAAGERGYGGPMGLCVDARGAVFVADYSTRRVLKVAPGGALSVVGRAQPPWSPSGVAAGPGGELYVLEIGFEPPRTYTGPRVLRLVPDGRSDVLVEVGRPGRTGSELTKPADDADAQREDGEADAQSASRTHADGLVKLGLVVLGLGLLTASVLAKRRR
ncbi:MAG TPA: hypothetical protein VF546_12545 [Pyrinomonadaceae bacterium]|jgi:hypothetical protein